MHLISLPLQLPDDRHVLVTFPVKLVYPVWQEYEQFDPYVLVQGTVSGTALGGVVNGGQLITENEKVTVYSRHQARVIIIRYKATLLSFYKLTLTYGHRAVPESRRSVTRGNACQC